VAAAEDERAGAIEAADQLEDVVGARGCEGRESGEQGRRAEARELLAPVYGWFTEGFGTADLCE
jgi:hypothetical protein